MKIRAPGLILYRPMLRSGSALSNGGKAAKGTERRHRAIFILG
ncbi:hypothetical protein HMPREF1986_01845 [Oribacterium sp. oral taxon 078 str. F0263]|nr:hypothetical protein HMPREF1986_01845 [Oribacterium sp. oral taxon 078 str. F0263]